MSGTTAATGPQAPSVFIQTFDSLVSSGCLASLSGNAFKALTVLGLSATPLGQGSRKNRAFFRDLVAAGVVSPADHGRLFACLRHRELVRRTGLSKNTVSRCTAELQAQGMVEKRRVLQAGGTAYNLFFLLPGAHLDKYNTLRPRPAPGRPAATAAPPSAGPAPSPHTPGSPSTSSAPSPHTPGSPGSASVPSPHPKGSRGAGSAPSPVPAAGRPSPSGPDPQPGTVPAVGTNSRSDPTTTPPTTCGAVQNSGPSSPGPPGSTSAPSAPGSPGAASASSPATASLSPPAQPHPPPLDEGASSDATGSLPLPAQPATPALRQARSLYRSEIGLVTPLVEGELRHLAEQFPDPSAWTTAFREAVGANVRQLRYVRRVLEARANGTSRNHPISGGNHVSRKRQSRRPGYPTEKEYAEAQRRASAVEPRDLLATLGTAHA